MTKPLIIVGAFRKGKSFLLNFLLRYLNAEGSDDWLEKTAGEELSGFHWCGGSQRDTTGVLIWSEVFTVVAHTGEEVAVVLMDTQVIIDMSLNPRVVRAYKLDNCLAEPLAKNTQHNSHSLFSPLRNPPHSEAACVTKWDSAQFSLSR